MRPVGKPPRPAVEKGPERRSRHDYRADPDSGDELEVVEGEPDTPAPTGERRPSVEVVAIPWAESTPPKSAEPSPNTWPAEAPTRVRREVERAASSMRKRELPGWLVQLAKWAAAPALALLTAYAAHVQAKTSLLREEAARAAADRAAKESDASALRTRITELEASTATLQAKLEDARQRVTDLERERAEAPLEVNPRRRRPRP